MDPYVSRKLNTTNNCPRFLVHKKAKRELNLQNDYNEHNIGDQIGYMQ